MHDALMMDTISFVIEMLMHADIPGSRTILLGFIAGERVSSSFVVCYFLDFRCGYL